jgi:hypothetical protein
VLSFEKQFFVRFGAAASNANGYRRRRAAQRKRLKGRLAPDPAGCSVFWDITLGVKLCDALEQDRKRFSGTFSGENASNLCRSKLNASLKGIRRVGKTFFLEFQKV